MAFLRNFGANNQAVLPVTNASGGPVPATFHIVMDFVNIAAATTQTITLSGAAVFASASSYTAVYSWNGAATQQGLIAVNLSGTQFQIRNPSGAPQNFFYCCIGS